MKRLALLLLVLAGAATTAAHAGTTPAQRFAATVDTILAQPYQPDYVPPGGAAAGSQLVDLGSPTRAEADALLGPDPCDTSRGAPGAGMP